MRPTRTRALSAGFAFLAMAVLLGTGGSAVSESSHRAAVLARSDSGPELVVPSAILEDLDSGQVLLSKAAHLRRPVASLTKIMSAIVVLEHVPVERTIVVDAVAASESGSGVGLAAGERVTVRSLLYAMLLESANDAAIALASHVAGSEASFVALMNERAAEMRLRDTHFFSATGLDDRGYSTAADLARMTREAYSHPLFESIVRTRFFTMSSPSRHDRHLQNRNVLLFRYTDAIGVKTGLTTAAGHCVIEAADRDGVRLLAVALGHPHLAFDDGAALLDYGYGAFRSTPVATRGEVIDALDLGGEVTAVVDGDLRWLLPVSETPSITREFREAEGIPVRVVPGTSLGTLIVRVDGERVGTVPVIARTPLSPTPGGPRSRSSAAEPPFADAVALVGRLVRGLVDAFL